MTKTGKVIGGSGAVAVAALLGVLATGGPQAGAGYQAVAGAKTYYDVNTIGNHREGVFNPSVPYPPINAPAVTVHAGYEGRYGVGSSPVDLTPGDDPSDQRRKVWYMAPDNELTSNVVNGLVLWCHSQSAEHRAQWSCDPTLQEITDVQATADSAIWLLYQNSLPGASAENPRHVTDPTRAHGPFELFDEFYRKTVFYFNDYAGPIVVPPPVDPPPVDPPPVDPPVPPAPTGVSCDPLTDKVRRLALTKGKRNAEQITAVSLWLGSCE